MSIQQVSEPQIKEAIEAAAQKHRSGQLGEAESIYSQVLQVRAEDVGAFNFSAAPDPEGFYLRALNDFGMVLRKQGKLTEAVRVFQYALQRDPSNAHTRNNLGVALKAQGKLLEATQAYRQALECDPSLAQAQSNLGDVLKDRGQFSAAIQAYRQALKLDPTLAKAHNNLGILLKARGQLSEAIRAYQQALKLDPRLAEAYSNLGALFKSQGRLAEAARAYQQALKINPSLAEVHYNLGNTFKAQGKAEAASQAYQQVLKLDPSFAEAEFALCMSQLPVMYASFEDIQVSRTRYRQHLHDFTQRYRTATLAERVRAAQAVGVSQPYYLAYQGQSDRELQKNYGESICSLMASGYPQWSSPVPPRVIAPGERIRVGFVSRYFHYHSIWKIPLKGWLENFDRSQFELFGYGTHEKQDTETAIANKILTKFICGSFSTSQWGEIIQQDRLDVLIFPEFGMDPMTVRLGCLRLAPVQAVFGGHPETSGLPTVDYHLTSDLMEPENGREHYTETLVRLPNLAVCYSPIEIQPEPFTKQDLGLDDTESMFWCCQSLYKYLPQHDDIFPKIAREVQNCKFIFIKHQGDNSEIVTKTFLKRLNRAFGSYGLDYKEYCVLLSRLERPEFAGVTAIADIFLDSIGWSGNNTAMEAAIHNLPMVTLPGKMMRGRHVMAILKRMGIHETIAHSKEEYVEIAVRLATDRSYRQQVVNRISKNKHRLYGDLAPIRALESFLIQAVKNPGLARR